MKCKNCGQEFDYEAYFGVCPKCGDYNKPENTAEKDTQSAANAAAAAMATQSEEFDSNPYDFVEKDSVNEFEVERNKVEREAAQQEYLEHKKHKTNYKVWLAAIAVIFAVAVGVAAVGSATVKTENAIADIKRAGDLQEIVTPKNYDMNETFDIESDVDCTLMVDQAKFLDEDVNDYLEIPDGQRVLAVRINEQGTSDMYDMSETECILDYYIYMPESDTYVSNLGSFQLEDYFADRGEAPNSFSMYSPTDGKQLGWMYFAVPEDVGEMQWMFNVVDEDNYLVKRAYSVNLTDIEGQASEEDQSTEEDQATEEDQSTEDQVTAGGQTTETEKQSAETEVTVDGE